MIELFKKLFSEAPSGAESETDSSKRITVSCLALMIETAKADSSLDEEELTKVVQLAQARHGLSSDEAQEFLEQAKQQVKDSTSLYEFTSLINENLNPDEKYLVIESMWQVAFADGEIDRYEEHIIRKAAELIYVEHVRFIEAKLSAQASAPGA